MESTQCMGRVCQKNNRGDGRCRSHTNKPNGFCNKHQDQAPQRGDMTPDEELLLQMLWSFEQTLDMALKGMVLDTETRRWANYAVTGTGSYRRDIISHIQVRMNDAHSPEGV